MERLKFILAAGLWRVLHTGLGALYTVGTSRVGTAAGDPGVGGLAPLRGDGERHSRAFPARIRIRQIECIFC